MGIQFYDYYHNQNSHYSKSSYVVIPKQKVLVEINQQGLLFTLK